MQHEQANQKQLQSKTKSSEQAYEKALKLIDFFGRHFTWFRKTRLEMGKEEFAEYAKHWTSCICDLTNEQLHAGCEWIKTKCEKLTDLNPTLFRRHCFGLVDSDMAFEMAKEDMYVHPAIWASASKITTYQWSHLDDYVLRKIFLRNYNIFCNVVMRGVVINMPDRPITLENKTPAYYSKKAEKTPEGAAQARALTELAERIAAKNRAKYAAK